jgi:hypothetical protein
MKHGMKKDKERMGMMYGGRKSAAGGMYMMDEKKRKQMMHGGPHNNMDRIGMFKGGAMDVQDPN